MGAETETFQHYQVLKREDGSLWELGRGAMGVTYKAFDTNLRSYVALKVINATYLHSETAKARFLREARAAAALSHPNVAGVYHLGNDEHSFFYAMEFIDGETLEAFVKRRGALPAALALHITLQVARALRAAHRIGLVHRDLKPANLMLLRQDEDDADEERLLKVIDFGLAKTSRKEGTDDASASASLTIAGFVGTPHFASPEQLEEKEIDTRSDIYSLGATLWYLLTGKPPFSGSLVQIMSQHLSRVPPFEALILAGVPEPAVALLRRMLQKDPADRPQTPGELRRDIEAALRALDAGGSGATTTLGATAGGALTAGPRETGDAGTVADLLPGSEPAVPAAAHPTPETAFVTVPPPSPGVVLAGRYRLLRTAGTSGSRGQLFQALDLERQHAVALKILHPELLSTEEGFARAREAMAQTQAPGAAHPVLIPVHDIQRAEGHTLLVTDWVDGLSLLEVLRHRGRLPRAEVFSLLEPLAAAADHAREHALPGLDFNLGQVLLGFDIAAVRIPPDTNARAALVSAPLTEWPSFLPRVSPLTLLPESGVLTTWAGGRTMVPAVTAPRPAAGSGSATGEGRQPAGYPAGEAGAAGPSYLEQLARLAYELLGGVALPADAAAPGFRCPPLAVLSERGNDVLRSVLTPSNESDGAPARYARASDFVLDLRDAATDFEAARLPPPGAGAPPPPPPPPYPVAGSSASGSASSQGAATAAVSLPPVPPPGRPPVAPVEYHRPEKGGLPALLGIVALLLLLVGLAVGGFFGWQAWERSRTAASTNTGNGSPMPPATPQPGPTTTVVTGPDAPTPPTRTPTPTPSPTVLALASPTPRSEFTPAPTPSAAPTMTREDVYRKKAVDAQRLVSSGDTAGALELYLDLAQEFPERDPDRSGLDGVVNDLRTKFPPGSDATTRRLQQLRPSLEKAASLGSESAAMYLGDSLVEDDPKAAADFYQQAADRGQPRAMIALGNLYFRGRGVPYDPAQVAYWYQKASDRGSSRAKVLLAECYRDGKGGVKRDPTRAFDLLNEALAIEPGNAIAIGELAGCYDKGLGTAPDARRAFELYKKAADLGNLNALSNLGVFYINGTGMARPDPRRAVELLRQGAEKDNPPCMFNLAKCLEAGIGVANGPNLSEARRWYRASAERGFQPAVEWCQRNGVAFTPKD